MSGYDRTVPPGAGGEMREARQEAKPPSERNIEIAGLYRERRKLLDELEPLRQRAARLEAENARLAGHLECQLVEATRGWLLAVEIIRREQEMQRDMTRDGAREALPPPPPGGVPEPKRPEPRREPDPFPPGPWEDAAARVLSLGMAEDSESVLASPDCCFTFGYFRRTLEAERVPLSVIRAAWDGVRVAYPVRQSKEFA